MNALFPAASVEVASDDDRLESIAKDVELLQATAILRVAERLAEAREIFRYRRDEGGFTGWCESRLGLTDRTARNLIAVYERFGGESWKHLSDFPRDVLYRLAAPSTPEPARAEVIARAEAGEVLSRAEVDALIAKAKAEAAEAERADAAAKIAAARDTARQAEQRALDLGRENEAAAQAAASKARADAEREIANLSAEIDRINAEAASRIASAKLAAVGEADKSLDKLRQMLADRDAALADKNARIDELLAAAAKSEKLAVADVKRMRREIDEAGQIVGFINDTDRTLAMLPDPKVAVTRAARRLEHAINPEKARAAGEWLLAFAAEWENRK